MFQTLKSPENVLGIISTCFGAIFESWFSDPRKSLKQHQNCLWAKNFVFEGSVPMRADTFLGCYMIITRALELKKLRNRFVNLLGMFRRRFCQTDIWTSKILKNCHFGRNFYIEHVCLCVHILFFGMRCDSHRLVRSIIFSNFQKTPKLHINIEQNTPHHNHAHPKIFPRRFVIFKLF